MARQARVKNEFGIFHITQRGGACRNLFQSVEDRNKFISILHKSKTKFNYLLHGFCLLEDNAYDLLIDVNGSDLSKIMKSINISYAMYAKCDGKLFTDRYKSEMINPEELDNHKRYLQEKRLSYVAQNDVACFSICFDNVCYDSVIHMDLEDCDNCIKCMDTASLKLEHIAAKKGLTFDELLADKDIRNQLIFDFRRSSTLSLKALGELFGGLSESSVSKIINNQTDN